MGVLNSTALKDDFFKRQAHIDQLESDNKALKEKHAKLSAIIARSNELQMKKAVG